MLHIKFSLLCIHTYTLLINSSPSKQTKTHTYIHVHAYTRTSPHKLPCIQARLLCRIRAAFECRQNHIHIHTYAYKCTHIHAQAHTNSHVYRLDSSVEFEPPFKADERRVRSLDLTKFKTPTGWRQPSHNDHLQSEIEALQSLPLPG